ncbi:MAG: sigma 54-interacting transcriptional regulator [candidate division WOR-3 bacterium]|nr:sigma 54-interacting transcriptional regulator [candidate division WOR-3 bacterium]
MAKFPEKIGRYEVIKRLETGNYAVVYKVRDKNNDLILKIARDRTPESNHLISREFQILSQFRHPNIVNVFDYDVTKDGFSYFTMEYVEGRPIDSCFKEFNSDFVEATIQIIDALMAFHNQGFVHSDLKPEHIIYNSEKKRVVLIDFGFAGLTIEQVTASGTFGYVAPEILKGIGADQRSDLYSLGVIIYRTLSGKFPSLPFKPIEGIPNSVNNTILRLLSEEPGLRPTAVELFETFRKFLSDRISEIPVYDVQLPLTAFVEISEIVKKLLKIKGEAVVINGEPGTGKTRLLKELKYNYLLKNFNVLFFTGREDGYFYNFISREIGVGDLRSISTEDQFQVYTRITESLIDFARNRNVVILVDDLDTLNDYELGLFRFIGHSIAGTNIALIGTSDFDPRVKELNFLELRLRPFSNEEVKALIRKTFFKIESKTKEDISSFGDWLHGYTGGNPLFIVETLKALFQQKILTYRMEYWQLDMKALNEFKVAEYIEEILSAKIKKLRVVELEVLKILCLADCSLTSSAISYIIPECTSINLEILKMMGLVKEEYIKGKRFIGLANQIIRMLIFKMMPEEERISIIKKIVVGLKNARIEECFYPMLGRLYKAIGEYKEAYKFFLLSAQNAERIGDYKSAIEFYKIAIDYSQRFESENYYKILLKLGDLSTRIDEHNEAIEYYNRCLESPHLKVETFLGLGKVYTTIGAYEEGGRYLSDALKIVKLEKQKIEILNRLAYCYINLKKFEEGKNLLDEALAISRQINDFMMEAEVRYYYATLEWHKGEFEKGKKMGEELLEFCNEHGLDKQFAYTANLLSSFCHLAGDTQNGIKYNELALARFEKIKNFSALVSVLTNKGVLLSRIDNSNEALTVFEKAYQYALRTGSKIHQYICLSNIAYIYFEKCRHDKALEFSQEALKIEPDSQYARYNICSIYYRRNEIDKAESILKEGLSKKEEPLYLIGLGTIYGTLGEYKKAEEYIQRANRRAEEGTTDTTVKAEVYLKSSQFYYENREFDKAIKFAEQSKVMVTEGSREYRLADGFIMLSKYQQGLIERLELEPHLRYLIDREFLFDYGYLKRLKIEAMVEKGSAPGMINEIAGELWSVEQIFQSIDARLELARTHKLLLKIFPIIIQEYSRRTISVQYLEVFSRLAELISSGLGDKDFMANILDLVIDATGAERGAIFIKTEKGMEFIAGRNMDRKTIKDAAELSKTAIEEMSKNKIVFVPNALDDPNYNIRKSVLFNQIRSILCIPLGTAENMIGAIYLDSRFVGAMFKENDRDFLITVSKILASVVEKSISFRNLAQENILLKTKVISEIGTGYLISKSKKMRKIYENIDYIANSDAPVLIIGETGTGKGMLARLIHLKSKRKDKKFLSINCGGIPETLLESELFGHKKGAFTGAYTDKKGLLEEGEGGTIFLDEISNTGPGFQAKMLEALEDKVIRRLGETTTRKIDVRFILASNKDLELEVELGRFRQDLYFRINVFRIDVPPLRERPGDIPELAKFFLNKYCKEMGKDIKGFEDGVIAQLKKYYWPGNVRELMNVIERAVTLARGNVITISDIGLKIPRSEIVPLREVEREAIIEALNATQGNKSKAAKLLGIPRRTLYNYLKKYSIGD